MRRLPYLQRSAIMTVALWAAVQTSALGQHNWDGPVLEIVVGDSAVTVGVFSCRMPNPMLGNFTRWETDDSWSARQVQEARLWRHSLLLQIDRNAHLSIPICLFRSAQLVGGKHIVALADGSKCEGRLIGQVQGKQLRGSHTYGDRGYDLYEARTVSLLNQCPVRHEMMVPTMQTPVWRLRAQTPMALNCELVRPRFTHLLTTNRGLEAFTRINVTEALKIDSSGAGTVEAHLPDVLRLRTSRARPRIDSRAERSAEEEQLLKQIAETQWLQTTPEMSLSPDGRYLAWAGRNSLSVVKTDTKTLVPFVSGATRVHSVYFLPGEESILAVAGSTECRLLDPVSASVISAASLSRRLKVKEPGAKLACTEHSLGLRALPGGIYASWWLDGLRIWKWTADTMAELLEASKTGTGRGGQRGLPCELVSSLSFDPWELDRRYERYGLVSQDGKWLLIPVCKKLPTKETTPAWALVALSNPQAPTIEGIVPDWLSDVSFNALYNAAVLPAKRVRRLAEGLPIYIGAGALMALGRFEGLAVVDAQTRSPRTEWSATEVARLQLDHIRAFDFLKGEDPDIDRLGTTAYVEMLDGATASGPLLFPDEPEVSRAEVDGWHLCGYLAGSAIRLVLMEPTCTLERASIGAPEAEPAP